MPSLEDRDSVARRVFLDSIARTIALHGPPAEDLPIECVIHGEDGMRVCIARYVLHTNGCIEELVEGP